MPGLFCVYNKLVNEVLATATLFVYLKKIYQLIYDINTCKD